MRNLPLSVSIGLNLLSSPGVSIPTQIAMQLARDMEWVEKKQDMCGKAIDSISNAKPLPGLDALFVVCCAMAGKERDAELDSYGRCRGVRLIHVLAAKRLQRHLNKRLRRARLRIDSSCKASIYNADMN